jgi:hypothetical protein
MDILSILLLFVVLLFVSFGFFAFWFTRRQGRRGEKQIRLLSARLGLVAEKHTGCLGGVPKVEGEFEGRAVQIVEKTSGGAEHNRTDFEITTQCKNVHKRSLMLTREGVFEKLGKAFGGQDIQVGNEMIDKKFVIKSNDVAFAQNFFNDQAICEVLLQHQAIIKGTFKLGSAELVYSERMEGVFFRSKDRERFEALVKLSNLIAQRVEAVSND